MSVRPPTGGVSSRSRLAAAVLALVVALGTAVAAPQPVAAATSASTVEAALLTLTNRDRAERGLRPLRRDARLADIAGRRAVNLTGASTFSHDAAGGSISLALAGASVQWYAWAENIAWWPGGLTSSTASALYAAWKASPSHYANLMSERLNYVGFGVAVRASNGRVYASTVFTESRDHTAPSARIVSATRSGTTVTFTWRGYDAPLQSHWSRLKDFDVWYRVDAGSWKLVRDNTTATSIRLGSRPRGHRYSLKVAARDGARNVGRASTVVSVWVP